MCSSDLIGIEALDREGRTAVLKFRPNAKLDPVRLVKVVRETSGAVLVPPASIKLDLDAAASRSVDSGRASAGFRGKGRDGQGSWWTLRARSGTVAPGFTRDELTRRAETDPRVEGGMFDRIQTLLRALGQ